MRGKGRGLLVLLMIATGAATPNADLKTYQTRYYIMHTDLGVEDAREAAIRMTRMVETYRERTKDFSGTINRKLPFYLYANRDDYYKSGGLKGSSGCFTRGALKAVAGKHPSDWTWHVVQHEGFHQFEAAVIGGFFPVWLNEGLAEYFGEGKFTGDNFYTGLIPQNRLKRIKKRFNAGEFKSIEDMMDMNMESWVKKLNKANYDQAWSMVHFLVHADGGAYQKPFSRFIVGLSRNVPRKTAWKECFGSTKGFEAKWKKYWTELPEDPNPDLETEVATATLTSFLARAHLNKMVFANWEEFIRAAQEGKIQLALDDNWLPPALLAKAIENLGQQDRWSLETDAAAKQPRIVVRLSEQKRLIGQFALADKKIGRVWVEVNDPAKTQTGK